MLRAAILACAILIAAAIGDARAQAFIDFQARSGPDAVGHAFIVYGRLDGHGVVSSARTAGFYTDAELYFLGLIVPQRGFVGGEKDDLTFQSAVVYRYILTERQFQELKRGIARVKGSQHLWHFLFFNCNDFVGEMAEVVGLRRPPSLLLPVAYVAALGAMNGLTRSR